MANMKQIKAKIKSTGNIKKTTRALEIVSTIKLQKIKKATVQYRDFVQEFMTVASIIHQQSHLFGSDTTDTKVEKELAIVLSSEKGLCGGMNTKLWKKAMGEKTNDTEYYLIGKKAIDMFAKSQVQIIKTQNIKDIFSHNDLIQLTDLLKESMKQKKYGRIVLYFNYFKNTLLQIPVSLQLYPLKLEELQRFYNLIEVPFEFKPITVKNLKSEPNASLLRSQLISQFIKHIIYGALLQNKASEMASRMVAMKNAKENASDMIKSLTLSFNKARQGAITQEISEIVGAKIAIESL